MLNNKSIVPITGNFDELYKFAYPILMECYDAFFKPGVIPAWIENNQSARMIEKEVKEGMFYYYLKNGADKAGYIALRPEKEELLLSKFYVEKNFRANGFGRYALNFMNEFGKKKNLKKIYCYCADYNTPSLEIYKKFGFTERGEYFYEEHFEHETITEREIVLEKPII
ncbi:GCN5-related N-acetyltransferase [Tritrichomonas foetus]|uniref:GCN5-related N-acetyltransferase n=1 Tax=Tritrichomonas foetus TaxID=1144522 RepID=A0A1J4KNS6_9EUKA|nr:GCN5-related N-acetyltransferase [Tritrichomonas foetus]|eukprot:OHT12943.1 GCN5-related N-acetyltransferase [Tritrichomonas foetus]